MAVYTVTRRLYHTADRTRVVEEGDPAAAFLYAGVGAEIPLADAQRYGLVGQAAAAKATAATEPEAAGETKAVHGEDVEDKGTDGPRARGKR